MLLTSFSFVEKNNLSMLKWSLPCPVSTPIHLNLGFLIPCPSGCTHQPVSHFSQNLGVDAGFLGPPFLVTYDSPTPVSRLLSSLLSFTTPPLGNPSPLWILAGAFRWKSGPPSFPNPPGSRAIHAVCQNGLSKSQA